MDDERHRVVREAGEILEKAKSEGRALSAEEDANWNKAIDRAEELRGEIGRWERQREEERAAALAAPASGPPEAPSGGDEDIAGKFRQWGRTGALGDGKATNNIDLRLRGTRPETRQLTSTAAQGGSDSAGGYLVSQEMANRIERGLKAYNGIRQAGATVLTTANGMPIRHPMNDDTSNEGEFLTNQNTDATEQNTTFDEVQLNAWIVSSKSIAVSNSLLDDSEYDLEGYLGDILGERIGRATAKADTAGSNGTNVPQSLVDAVVAAGVRARGSNPSHGSVTWTDYVDLMMSVDAAYRDMMMREGGGSVGFMFNSQTLRDLMKLKDNEERSLFLPGIAGGRPDTIIGAPFWVNEHMASTGAANRSIALFGDFRNYVIREVSTVRIRRLTELRALRDQTVFVTFMRHDGRYLNPGTDPIKVMTTKA